MPVDNSVGTLLRHYIDTFSLKPRHQAVIAEGIQEQFDKAVGPRVLSPKAFQSAAMDPEVAAIALDCSSETVQRLVDGSNDVWISSCTDFYDGPNQAPGLPCGAPVWAASTAATRSSPKQSSLAFAP